MHLYFIENGKRYLYDTVCGGICEVTRLQKEMLPYVQKLDRPLPDVCPTTLRYSLAKYEVSAINEAYKSIMKLIGDGLLSIDDECHGADSVKIRFEDTELTVALRAAKLAITGIPTVETGETVGADEVLFEKFTREIQEDFSFVTVK